MPQLPDACAITLGAILNSLHCMAISVPYIQPVVVLASAIICGIQQLKENKRAFARLAKDVYNMVEAIAQVHIHSVELQHSVEKFSTVLQQILHYLQEHGARGSILRFFGVAYDASRIKEYRSQIQTAREVFELQMEMRTHENIILIARLCERNASRTDPPPYTVEDSTIPEDVRRIAQDDSERLLPILGVFSVFQEPPTIKQLTRVLGFLAEDEVREVWGPISVYLDGLDSDGQTRSLAFLERLACQAGGTTSIDSTTYHNLVARWCLVGPKGGARDVFYAANSWAHHVCHSDPSIELLDALTESEIPLAFESSEDLPAIIAWLEGIQSDEEQWGALLSTYRAQLATTNGR
ncbi:hypothetical protein B0H13DRAFT_2329289 [Mycena leptocephala]|nr:hypothetical protein B0H13DRAFT_2329289 [Mycena leptocephala]